MVITFRKGVAHAQDRHQVIHIAVDALCDSRVLQKPRVGYNGLRKHYTVAVNFVNQNKFKPVRASGGRTHGPLTTNATQNTSSKTALTLLSAYWWDSLFQNISKLFVLLKKVERRDVQIQVIFRFRSISFAKAVSGNCSLDFKQLVLQINLLEDC